MTLAPRVVLVHRHTEYDELLARHGSHGQAEFYLSTRGRDIAEIHARHARQQDVLRQVEAGIPLAWRQGHVERADLPQFLFGPEDIIAVVGQDGLVANLAKYLDGQPVIGLNPQPDRFPGVLVRHDPSATADLLADVAGGRAIVEARTMVAATLDDGQQLLALNEIFVGHATHQSARYTLSVDGRSERQSSSGLIVSTGTGATGWAASLNQTRAHPLPLPAPADPRLAWFVREAWPSATTSTQLVAGILQPPDRLIVACELGDGGVVFGDGIENDTLRVDWGQRVTVSTAERALHLAA